MTTPVNAYKSTKAERPKRAKKDEPVLLVQEGSPPEAFGGSLSTPRDSANYLGDFPKTKGGGRNEVCSLVAQAMRAEATAGGLEWIERAPAEAERRLGSNNAALMGPPSPITRCVRVHRRSRV